MSDYVAIKLALSKKGYDKLKELHTLEYPGDAFFVDKANIKFSNGKGLIVFDFFLSNNSYLSDECTKLKNLLSEINEQGYGYNLITIGEERNDIYESYESGSSKEEDFIVIEAINRIDLIESDDWF